MTVERAVELHAVVVVVANPVVPSLELIVAVGQVRLHQAPEIVAMPPVLHERFDEPVVVRANFVPLGPALLTPALRSVGPAHADLHVVPTPQSELAGREVGRVVIEAGCVLS